MPTLTEVSYQSRKIIKYSAISLITYIFLKIFISAGISYYKQMNPPPPPPPTMGFGPISKLEFPKNPGYEFKFQLQTPTGKFPAFTDRATVYYMPFKKADLFAYDEAKNVANQLKFFSDPKQINSTIYEWRRKIPALLSLKMDIINGSFSYQYQWQSDNSILNSDKVVNNSTAYQIANQFFAKAGASMSDINFASGKISYLKAKANKMVPAISLSEADFVRVDYFRRDIDKLKILTATANEGVLNITISKSSQYDKQVVEANSNYFPINYLQPETYPLTQVALAWESLKNGEAYIASNNSNEDSIIIRRISLAYFDSPQPQEFFQPIYVFAGDDDFVAYVPAIADVAIKK
jgi:hypothetical protein